MVAALWALRGQLPAVARVAASVHPRWSFLAAASLLVLATYALLIESWRRVVEMMGGSLGLPRAAVIWLGSNLGRYLPFSLWQLGAMGVMASRDGVPVAVSTGAAVLMQVVSLVSGVAVFVVTAARTPGLAAKGRWLIIGGSVALLFAPLVVPRFGRVLARMSGRELTMPRFSLVPVLVGLVTTTIQWLAYGVAFWMLVRAILPESGASIGSCIALYTGAYLAGLLAVAPPAGLGVSDGFLIAYSSDLGVATTAEATVLAVVVRLWRTVLEVVPGVAALSVSQLRLRRGAVS